MDRIERAICKQLSSLMEHSGFHLHKEWGIFVRARPYGHDAMLIVNKGSAGTRPRHFKISAHCSIRHDSVEIPWNTLGLVYGDGQLQTDTLVLGFPRGMAAPQLMITPATMVEDTTRVVAEASEIFTKIALPFYDRFADLSRVEELANKHPLQDIMPYTVGGPMEHRAMRSLLLAKLVNPARYSQVRAEFIRLNQGMFPLEHRMAMLQKVDQMAFAPLGSKSDT